MQMWEHFLGQVYGDAQSAGSYTWMLVWKKDRRQALIYTSPLIIRQLIAVGAHLNSIPHIRGHVRLKDDSRISVYLCVLEDFLATVTSHQIKEVLENGSGNASTCRKRT